MWKKIKRYGKFFLFLQLIASIRLTCLKTGYKVLGDYFWNSSKLSNELSGEIICNEPFLSAFMERNRKLETPISRLFHFIYLLLCK